MGTVGVNLEHGRSHRSGGRENSFNSSRHERVARLGPGEDAGVQRVARFSAGEVALVLPRNNSVRVDTLGSAADHGLQVLAEVGRLELGVELGGQVVTEVSGVIRVVVAPDAPGVLVFGEIARNEFDGVEWVGFTSLSGSQDSATDGFLGDLYFGKSKMVSSQILRSTNNWHIHSCDRSSPRRFPP